MRSVKHQGSGSKHEAIFVVLGGRERSEKKGWDVVHRCDHIFIIIIDKDKELTVVVVRHFNGLLLHRFSSITIFIHVIFKVIFSNELTCFT